jgi:hypothetical protein
LSHPRAFSTDVRIVRFVGIGRKNLMRWNERDVESILVVLEHIRRHFQIKCA